MVSIRYACKASCDWCAIISHFKGGISPLVEDDICVVLFDISMIFKPSNIEKNGGKVTLSRINNIIIYCLEIDIPDRLTGGNGIIPGLDCIKFVAPVAGRKTIDCCNRTGSVQGDCFECACTFTSGRVFERAAGQLGTGFNHQLDSRVQCVSPTGKIIISAFQRQRVIARIKIPAGAGIICPVAVQILCSGRVTVLVNHQPGQRADGYG